MMANSAPNSYKDPFWSTLAMNTEQKLGLPDGLLVNIVTRGERSNADQVSEAGAKTPFQIVPATRKAAIDKYGIDPYLSPENAAEVAGLLLKDSLARNGGDAAAAVGEYHGGTDRANWGPRTKSYVARVMTGLRAQAAAAPAADQGTQSTFDRVMSQQSAPKEPQIAAIFNAYQSGQMTPDEAREFEQDVKSGLIMLPRGAALKSEKVAADDAAGAQSGDVLPAGVLDAYANGQMTPDERAQLEADVKSGLVKLPPGAVLGNTSAVAQIPGANPAATTTPTPEPSMSDQVVGAGEAALNAITGGTTGMLGMAGGVVTGLVNSVQNGTFGKPEGVRAVEQAAAQGADALTYSPRTAAGQERAQAVGDAMQNLLPVAPLTGEMAAMSAATAPATRAIGDQAAATVAQTKAAAASVPGKVASVVQRAGPDAAAPTPGTMGSVGAAGVDMATQRRNLAGELPVPIELTKGQAERSFEQQRFEQETAKDPNLGAPLRDRYSQQNEDILKNFDAWVDQTGAEAPNLRAVGVAVDKALVDKAARDKAEIRVAYKAAEKAGEMAEPVATDKLTAFLNESSSAEAVAPVLKAAKAELIRLGGAEADSAGNLVPKELTLADTELLRRFVNRVAGADPTNIKYAADLKSIIDTSTEGLGGNLYQKARALRARHADQYENRAVIAELLRTNRGTQDRTVALEDVWNHSIMKGSLDDVRTVRRILQTAGDDGKQAWRELQGATVNWIKDEATKGVATDTRGNPIVSAAWLNKAIRSLDHDGKLDFVFGKKGAQQLRDINDLAKVVFTSPPGAVNTSNTASVLLAALAEAGTWGSATGLPVPVLTGLRQIAIRVKDRRIQRRVEEALNNAKQRSEKTVSKQEPKMSPIKINRTLH